MNLPRRDDLRPFGMDHPIPHPHLIHAIHQLGHEEKAKARIAKRGNAPLRGDDHLGIFDRVLDRVLVEHKERKLTDARTAAQ